MLKLEILGEPRTKKNSPQIRYKGAKCPMCHKGRYPFVSPSDAFEQYEQMALVQIRRGNTPIDVPVNVKCVYYMGTHRRIDLCNLLEATCDILVDLGVLADDNSKIVASHDGSRVLYDKINPRVEIEIEVAEDGN
jgi:Holliday junction resolvase RusA-like endonuclease